MAYACRYGPTAAVNRASWGPASATDARTFDRPLSGNFDRIFNVFERTNAFEYSLDDVERRVGNGDVVVNRKSSASFADCSLAAHAPSDDEDYYREKILYSQARQLFPLQEDLADWINKTIGITYLTGENFLDALDNGVELCQLAGVIHERAAEAVAQGLASGPVASVRGRCWRRAARRSFFSRDNTENFITFARDLGVHENLLFESDDLVLHNQPRQVILCLLEVARIATKYNVEPPGLVQLEKEIALEERDSGLDSAMSSAAWQFRDVSPTPGDDKSAADAATNTEANDSQLAVDNADAESTRSGGTVDSSDSDVPLKPTNELDKRVQLVTRLMERSCSCGAGKCSKLLKVKKVGEGRYNIAGRNVFIRLLKGRHMMVRVGGGWDTLEHFLSRHEPCQVRLVTQGKRAVLLPPPPADRLSHSNTSLDASSSISGETAPEKSETLDVKTETVDKRETKPSPQDARRASTPKPAASVEKSPVDKGTRSGKTSPLDVRRTSTPKPATRKSTMTLALNEKAPRLRKQSAPSFSTPNTPTTRSVRTPPIEHRKSLTSTNLTAPKKSRSMSLATPQKEEKKFCGTDKLNAAKARSLASTPTEPRKVRSQSLATTPVTDTKKSFCGTDRLNTYVKKTRSMSLATPIAFKPINKSSSVTVPGAMTQAAIEESIRLSLAASIEDNSSKPFLHIKAKYRSPPPREVPPR